MADRPSDPRLAQWADHIEGLRWSALILDADWHVQWVSSELKLFMGTESPERLGYGLHVAESLLGEAWISTVEPDSAVELFLATAPYFTYDFERRGRSMSEIIPEPFRELFDQIEPAESPPVWSTSFRFIGPNPEERLPPYRVDVLVTRMHEADGTHIGWLVQFFMGVRPNLLTLLARGDEAMYERMALLVDPGPREAAILFCDVHQSTSLARQLSTPAYFKLVRDLWTGIDAIVADELGIVGKHAGDGASAFFLVGDLGSPSAASAAAVRAARRIHEISHEVFSHSGVGSCQMKVGLHWGGGLFMGQLVPGGRLDVTALGDEVNEAARIQECAGPHETLASKQLLERLTPEDAASLGFDVEKVLYRPLAESPTASAKAARDAGAMPVTSI